MLRGFAFQPGVDSLFSVGDVLGRGPDPLGCLQRLREFNAQVVRGNHEHFLLQGADCDPDLRSPGHHRYLASLGPESETWLSWIRDWPLWLEQEDLWMVHAGLQPGCIHPQEMRPAVLLSIRTWDGQGQDLQNRDNKPWFDVQSWPKTVVFGHWAQKGLICRPGLIGLDSGCVYGRQLSGWCPEENRVLQVSARKVYQAW